MYIFDALYRKRLNNSLYCRYCNLSSVESILRFSPCSLDDRALFLLICFFLLIRDITCIIYDYIEIVFVFVDFSHVANFSFVHFLGRSLCVRARVYGNIHLAGERESSAKSQKAHKYADTHTHTGGIRAAVLCVRVCVKLASWLAFCKRLFSNVYHINSITTRIICSRKWCVRVCVHAFRCVCFTWRACC